MTNSDEPTHKTDAAAPKDPADVETPTPGLELGVSAITRRWKRDELLKKGSLFARGFAFFLSLLSFIITASNKHGDWKNFDNYEEYRYLLAIAILSTFYSGVQASRHVNALWNAKQMLDQRISAMVDFAGDQVVAYLLMSSVSAAVPLTNRMREGQDNHTTENVKERIGRGFHSVKSESLQNQATV
ncbi:hypothetical protein GQ457_17G006160 [Hibiscus cannabinus]